MSPRRTSARVFHFAKELRRNQTPAEQRLWQRLRAHRLNGLSFRRQHAIGPFIVDFCCPRLKLVIEVDGASHMERPLYDAERTAWLNEHGWQELRFTNLDVEHNMEVVLEQILEAANGVD